MISSVTFSAPAGRLDLSTPASPTTSADQQAGPGSFGDVMSTVFADAARSLRGAEAAAIGGIEGTVPLQTVVESVMAAERTLQASVAIRDKIVSSYLEISRMQI